MTCGAQHPGTAPHFHLCTLEPMHGMGGGSRDCKCKCGFEWDRFARAGSGRGTGWTGGAA